MMSDGKPKMTKLVVLNRRMSWSWTEVRERSTFAVSVFKFSGESNQHVSIEAKPNSSRFYRLPVAFQQLRVLLEARVKQGWFGEVVLNLTEEQGMRPHSSLLRRWEITWRMTGEDACLLRYKWIGPRFPFQHWVKWVQELRVMTGHRELKRLDASVYIGPERMALLPVSIQKAWAEKLDSFEAGTAGSINTAYIFKGWHPKHEYLFTRQGIWYSFKGAMPQAGLMDGKARKITFGGRKIWSTGFWISVEDQ